ERRARRRRRDGLVAHRRGTLRSARTLKLFLDTGVLIAAVLPKDANHEAGRRIMTRVAVGEWSAVYTSDYVVAETLNYVRARVPRRDVAEAVLRPVFGHPKAPPAVTGVLR